MTARLSQYLQEDPKPGSLWGDDTYHVTFHPTDFYELQTLVNLLIEEEDLACRLAIAYELRDGSGHWITCKSIYERDKQGKTVYAPTLPSSIAAAPVLIADRSSSPWGTCWTLAVSAPPDFQPEQPNSHEEE